MSCFKFGCSKYSDPKREHTTENIDIPKKFTKASTNL